MCYYTYELDEESANLCVIVTPFGKFRYMRLPMGIKQSPDFAQEIIEEVLRGLDECEVYIDDVGTFNNDWESHLKSLDQVLERLEANGFKVNPLKCEWAVQETDWLGYWLTPTGLKPWKKKIDAILKMGAPTNQSQTRSFLGAVTYYRDMWPLRSHILAPLTELTGKGKFIWEPKHQASFEQMKAMIASEAMLHYPDHNIPFEIYTDASDYQLGAVLMQKGKPVAYYSRKLNSAQKNYTTMEKELLSIVATLKEFHTMLFGAKITVYTDHKNLTFHNLTSQRVIRWRNFLEEYSPRIVYIEGPFNVIADAFSRLPRLSSTEGKSTDITNSILGPSVDVESHFFSFHFDDDEMKDCFLNHPPLEEMQYPLDFGLIRQNQFDDAQLQLLHQQKPLEYPVMDMGNDVQLICQVRPGKPWRIAIPTVMVDDIIRWYHLVLGHCGIVRLHQTIATHFVHPFLKARIERIVKSCDTCLRSKLPGAGYGLLPPREATLVPWYEVAVDLIGPWTISVHGVDIEFNALTCIDPVSNIVELVRIENKSAAHVGMLFENHWMARYPKPDRCVHDNGGEFIGADFQRVLAVNGVKDVPTTVKNPQSNAICERMHQTAGNIIRTLTHTHPPANMQVANQVVDSALASTMHALRCSMHHALGMSPGAFVYQRDMFLNIPLIANLQTIQERKQVLINENLRRQNLKRRSFDYVVNEEVLLKVPNPRKLDDKAEGPYVIRQVHVNGTVTIQRSEHVTERINIRRVIPYRRPD
jgi:transposase InsO family protein